MNIGKEQIQSFIPQKAPFIMIDNLINAVPDRFETDFKVLSDNIFLEKGVLREFGLIENIAQSGAAGLAVTNNTSTSRPIEGFIGSVSKLCVYDLPKVNDTINTVVTLVAQFENMFLLNGANYANGKKLLECEVKLVGM